MGNVYTGASMSLDGYIAGHDGSGFDQLFQWYGNGDVSVPTADPGMTLSLTPESAAHWAAIRDRTGVLVVGRRLFDFTKGWNGNHPLGLPVVVVTHAAPEDWPHPDAPFTFVTGGIEAAIAAAQEIAGDKIVGVNARHDRQPVRARRPARRGLGRPRPGGARRRRAAAEDARGGPDRARRAARAHPGQPRHPPALRRAQGVSAVARPAQPAATRRRITARRGFPPRGRTLTTSLCVPAPSAAGARRTRKRGFFARASRLPSRR